MKSLVFIIAAIGLGCALVGCSSSEPAPAAESPTSKQQAEESASKWTPEQVAKFDELNKEARGVNQPQGQGQGVLPPGESK